MKNIIIIACIICLVSSVTVCGQEQDNLKQLASCVERGIPNSISIICTLEEERVKAKQLLKKVEEHLIDSKDEAESTKLKITQAYLWAVLGDTNAATNSISNLIQKMGRIDGEQNTEVANQILMVCATMRISGFPTQAQNCEEKILEIIQFRNIPTESLFMILKRAYLRGQLNFVLDSFSQMQTDESAIQDDYNFCWLRAKTFYSKFWTISNKNGWATEQEARQWREAAKACTVAYEKAVRAAPNKLIQMQIANQWRDLLAYRRFDADSTFLRESSMPGKVAKFYWLDSIDSTDKKHNIQDSQILDQLKAFNKAMLEGLSQGPVTGKLPQKARLEYANNCTRILESFCVSDIPQEVMSRIIRDVPTYWKHCFPPYFKDRLKNDVLSRTFAWYLWGAIVRPLPDKYEREFIDQHIESYATLVEQYFDRILLHPKFKLTAQQDAERFRSGYRKWKDNCFIPYFKTAYLPFELKRKGTVFFKGWKEQQKGAEHRAKEYNPRKDRWPKEHWVRQQAIQKSFLTVPFFTQITWLARPDSRAHCPSRIANGATSTLTDEWVNAFLVDGDYAVPSAPWKKFLTQKERANARK